MTEGRISNRGEVIWSPYRIEFMNNFSFFQA